MRRQLIEEDHPLPRVPLREMGPEEVELGLGAQVALGMVLEDVLQERALPGEVASAPPGQRLREDCVVRQGRVGEVPVQRLPERRHGGVLRERLQLREQVEGASAQVGIRAAQHHRRERGAGLPVIALLAQCTPAVEPGPAGERIGRVRGDAGDVLGGGLVLRRQASRREHGKSFLEQRRGGAVAGAAAPAERRELEVRELVERLAVAVHVEQRLCPADQLDRRNRLAGAQLPLPGARRIGGGRERVVQPGGSPVRARLVLGSRGELRVAGEEMGGGDVRAHLAAEDRLQHLLDLRRQARPGQVRLLQLPGPLQHRLVRVDIARGHLREQPVGGGHLSAVDGAQGRQVERAVAQGSARGRQFLERGARCPRPVGRPQGERLQPPRRRVLRMLRQQLQRLRGAARLQRVGGLLQRS